MVPTSPHPKNAACNLEKSTTLRVNCTPQTSHKRRNSHDNHQNDLEVFSSKRECAMKDHLVVCPLAEYGCQYSSSSDGLLDHYSSKAHQEILMKLVEIYVRRLHSTPDDDTTDSNFVESEHAETLELLTALAEGVSSLNDDNAQLYTNFVELQNTSIEQQKQIGVLRQSINETSQIYNAAQTNSQILQTEMESVKQTLTDGSSLASHDGSFIWRINNVTEHVANAVVEKQTSIYSTVFYSSPTGYKFCMRLYFNGDGNARGTHLSLFFVIMRGNYDPLLIWPFQHKITFCLYDQTGGQRHIIDSFRPDIKSNSFQQPRSNMNIASGLPKFALLSTIKEENNPYVRDDCMFIRCVVDFDSLPKPSMSYKINLNPALPVNLQHRMVQAEFERQRRDAVTQSSTIVENLNEA